MSEPEKPQPESESAPTPLAFSDFLENHPPNQLASISEIIAWHPRRDSSGSYRGIATPEIQLHCPSEPCNGVRFFRCISPAPELNSSRFAYTYLTYRCWNCQKFEKVFSVAARTHKDDNSGDAIKFGEIPPFGPPTSARLIKLIGPDRETFLKGRRCENQGLGIGAFIYYRRVVENQKNRILLEIAKVAERVGASPDTVTTLKRAAEETQFSRALEVAKPAIPESLLISGHNPLGLLHSALSEGVHERTDEECLEIAGSVRVVLAELSERLAQALKDEAELRLALSTIMKPRNAT